MDRRSTSQNIDKLLRDSFETIAVKFILNLPREQKKEKQRLAYHYKKAYYYFVDHDRKQILPHLTPKQIELKWFIDQFNLVLCRYMKTLAYDDVMKILNRQRPTCGAIILNQRTTKALVISAGGRLGFPKGQKNQNQTAEDCAGREVKEEVGLFIHRMIHSNEKVQFLGREDASITFFIVHNFDERQPLTIDKNEIDDAFWMSISEISKQLNRFSQKCRQGWREYQSRMQTQPNLSMQQFLKIYRQGDKSKSKQKQIDWNVNPLLNFELDRNRLFSVFRTVDSA